MILPEGDRRDEAADALHHPRVRRRPSPGRAGWPRAAVWLRQGLDPRRARPRLRDRAPRLRRLGGQRPARPGAGRGAHPATSRPPSPRRRAPGPAAQRPLVGRLEQPLAPGDLPRHRSAATWSTSPDPVDFRDFQQINLYARATNLFRDPDGARRPIARRGTRPVLFFDDFSRMEDVLGDGGQLRSFEAVFSPLGPDGRPRPLWDRATGAIDPEVAQRLGGLRHPAGPRAELADARPQARRQAPCHHRRARHVLPRRRGPAPEGVAGEPGQRRGRGDRPGQGPRHAHRRGAGRAVRPRDEGGPGSEGRAGVAPSPRHRVKGLLVSISRRMPSQLIVAATRHDFAGLSAESNYDILSIACLVTRLRINETSRAAGRLAGRDLRHGRGSGPLRAVLAEAAIQMFAEKGFDGPPRGVPAVHRDGRGPLHRRRGRGAGHPARPRRDKARTYAIYLDLIKGRLVALAGRPRFRGRVPPPRPAAGRRVERRRDQGRRQPPRDRPAPRDFDVVVDGGQVARKKPAPDIFLEATRRLGLEPSSCLVIEDAISGVAAAKAAGLPLPGRDDLVPPRAAADAGRLGRPRDSTTSRRRPRSGAVGWAGGPAPGLAEDIRPFGPGFAGNPGSGTIPRFVPPYADARRAVRPGATMPVLDREEYIEQAYFFHAFRERVLDGMPAQDVLARIGEELLSTTRLPLAVSFLPTEIKGTGLMGPAMARLGHYFTPFQTHVVSQAELDVSRFTDGPGAPDPGARGASTRPRGRRLAGPLRLPVRGPLAEPARLRQGPRRDGRRPVLRRRLARLHQHAPRPARRRRFRRPDLRPLGLLRDRAAADAPRLRAQVPRPSSARRKGRSPAPTGAATRSTCSRRSSVSSATPRSPAPAAPTRPRPASPCWNSGSRCSKTGSRRWSEEPTADDRPLAAPRQARGHRRPPRGVGNTRIRMIT